MNDKFEKQGNAIVWLNDAGEKIAEITYQPKEGYVIADHTFVDPSLRGQGVAQQLLDALVEQMQAEGKKIKAECPYVVRKFEEEPETYAFIDYDAK